MCVNGQLKSCWSTMYRMIIVLFVINLSSCVTNTPYPYYVNGCLNWTPLYLDKDENREEAVPEKVYLKINKELERKLISLIPKKPVYSHFCWYRTIKNGGLHLTSRENVIDNLTYTFVLKSGTWNFEESFEYIIVN